MGDAGRMHRRQAFGHASMTSRPAQGIGPVTQDGGNTRTVQQFHHQVADFPSTPASKTLTTLGWWIPAAGLDGTAPRPSGRVGRQVDDLGGDDLSASVVAAPQLTGRARPHGVEQGIASGLVSAQSPVLAQSPCQYPRGSPMAPIRAGGRTTDGAFNTGPSLVVGDQTVTRSCSGVVMGRRPSWVCSTS